MVLAIAYMKQFLGSFNSCKDKSKSSSANSMAVVRRALIDSALPTSGGTGLPVRLNLFPWVWQPIVEEDSRDKGERPLWDLSPHLRLSCFSCD